VKLSDFGLAAQWAEPREQTLITRAGTDPKITQQPDQPPHAAVGLTPAGSPLHMAPEAFQHRGGFKSDIWALGITCFEMAQGEPPRSHLTNLYVIKQTIIKGRAPTLSKFEGGAWSPEFTDFLAKCLVSDAAGATARSFRALMRCVLVCRSCAGRRSRTRISARPPSSCCCTNLSSTPSTRPRWPRCLTSESAAVGHALLCQHVLTQRSLP
jgi:serine/threonine protein kinase